MKHWRLTMAAWPLLLGLAMAPAASAEEGDRWEFSGMGDSEAEACEVATQQMQGENHAALGDGSCEQCEELRRGVYPYESMGLWSCSIWGVEQAPNDTFLVLPSSDDDMDVDEDEDADEDADEDVEEEAEDDAGEGEEDEDP